MTRAEASSALSAGGLDPSGQRTYYLLVRHHQLGRRRPAGGAPRGAAARAVVMPAGLCEGWNGSRAITVPRHFTSIAGPSP